MIRYFRAFVFWFFLAFFVIFLGSVLPLLSIFSKDRERLYQRAIGFCSRVLLALCWIRLKVHGKENLALIDQDKGLLLAANHASFLDSFILFARVPFPFRLTVYPAGFRIPFLRTVYRGAGYIGVGAKGVGSLHHLSHLFRALRDKEKESR